MSNAWIKNLTYKETRGQFKAFLWTRFGIETGDQFLAFIDQMIKTRIEEPHE